MTIEETEMYHNMGLMPDWAYYQQNGKGAMDNYISQKRNRNNCLEDRQIESQLYDRLEDSIYKTLEQLFDGIVIKQDYQL